MAEPPRRRRKELGGNEAPAAPVVPPKLAIPADFPEDDVHERARATVRGLFRKNLELVGRKP